MEPGGGKVRRVWGEASIGRRAFFDSFLCILEAEAFAIGFKDVNAVGEPIQKSPGEALAAHDLGPVFQKACWWRR